MDGRCGRTAATAAVATVGSLGRQAVDAGGERPRRRPAFEDAEERRLGGRLGGGQGLDDESLGAPAGDGEARHRCFAGDGRTGDDVVDEGGDRWRRPAGKGHGSSGLRHRRQDPGGLE